MPNPTTAAWVTERSVARAHKLWDAGERTADIGRAVGVSRDTIVGYARRHGWGPHPKPPWGGIHRRTKPQQQYAKSNINEPRNQPPNGNPPPQGLEPQQKAVRRHIRIRPIPKPKPAVAAPEAPPVAVYQPTPAYRQCQWIETQRPLRMCDAPTVKGGAWCADHRAICYHRPPRWSYAPGEPA